MIIPPQTGFNIQLSVTASKRRSVHAPLIDAAMVLCARAGGKRSGFGRLFLFILQMLYESQV